MTSLADVARHAGVSPMTVSNVVNNKPTVAPATRMLVEASIRHLGYKPNLSARHLAKGKTGIVLLILPEMEIPYFAELASAMMRAARPHGYDIVTEQTEWSRGRELEILRNQRAHLTDGLLLYPATLTQADLPESATTLPLVLFGGSEAFSSVDHVVIDNRQAAREATEHLIAQGFRRVALLGPHSEPQTQKPNSRLVGYAQALAAAKLPYDPDLVVNAPSYHRQDGYEAMGRLLETSPRPDAVFCLSDLLAIGAMRACTEAGLHTPSDIAIVGFDDVEEASFTSPPLTSVRPDKTAIATHSLDLLTRRLADPARDPELILAGHEVVVRQSSGEAT